MCLWLEESIKIPEWRLYISISLHFFEAHFNEDFFKLLSCFEKDVQIAILYLYSLSLRIEFFEGIFFPRVVSKHSTCNLCLKLYFLLLIVGSLFNDEICLLLLLNYLSFLQPGQLLLWNILQSISNLEEDSLIFIFIVFLDSEYFIILEVDNFFRFGISESKFKSLT